MNYYSEECFLSSAIGNNAIDFEERKKNGSDDIVRIPPMIVGILDDVKIIDNEKLRINNYAYEYIDGKGRLVNDYGLKSLVEIEYRSLPSQKLQHSQQLQHKNIFIIDNHNHAFYCRYKSYLSGDLKRGSHLIHIDQHSDLNDPLGNLETSDLHLIAQYTNEILDIASFIKPAKTCGLLSDYEMILTEYSLLYFKTTNSPNYQITNSLILDIDLDFRAPEMSIAHYDQTIHQVRKLISLPQVHCITIATSPTYIDQTRALEILHDVLD